MTDDRTHKSTGEDRQSRELSDRPATEQWEISNAERLEMFRAAFNQSHLPDLPCPPGYKVCWLTTSNVQDSVAMRISRLGYKLMRPEDVPGYEIESTRDGPFAGCIKVNEMVAAMLPIDLYNLYMREAHAVKPMQQEEKLNAAVEAIQEQAAQRGLKVASGADAERWI